MTDPDGYYTFIHETLMENIADVYLRTSPFHAVEVIEFKYVAGFLERSLTVNKTIPKNLFEPICKRVTNEIERGNVLEICRCGVWNSDTFIETWIEFLQSDMKAYTTEEILKTKDTVTNAWDIQYKIMSDLSSIHYSPVTSYELISAALCSVINTLIFCSRSQAVISLLADDALQFKNLDEYWRDTLELGLEMACTQGNKIDLIEAIVHSKLGDRLNGSKALAISLAFSNAEYSETLLKGTNISSQFADTSGRGLFHYLVDSNIIIEKFESIANLLNDTNLSINETDITGEPLIFSLAERLVKQKDGFERFQVLRGLGACINIRDTAGRNFVLYSVEKLNAKDCLKVLKSLEDTQVEFQCTDQHGANAMHYFCANTRDMQSEELFKFLVHEKSVNVLQIDNTGRVPLMLALLNACPNYCIAYLLDHSPKGHIDKYGRGFFHYLCSSNVQGEQFNNLCDKLLNRGEEINLLDSEGISPLFECLRNINFSMEHITYMIACGAKVGVTDVNGRNIVLHTITWRRKHDDIEQFLKYFYKQSGVNFLALDNDGKNALHLLFDSDNHDEYMTHYYNTVCDFLTKVAHVDCNQPDHDKVTPVMLGLEHYPDLACVKNILKNDIPNVIDNRGRNYFHFLVLSNTSDETFQEICSTLVEKHIDINHKDCLGRSPLFDCLVSQKMSRMECLVKCGAKADQGENWGEQVIAEENIAVRNSILEEAGLEFEPDAFGADGYPVVSSSNTSDDEERSDMQVPNAYPDS